MSVQFFLLALLACTVVSSVNGQASVCDPKADPVSPGSPRITKNVFDTANMGPRKSLCYALSALFGSYVYIKSHNISYCGPLSFMRS